MKISLNKLNRIYSDLRKNKPDIMLTHSIDLMKIRSFEEFKDKYEELLAEAKKNNITYTDVHEDLIYIKQLLFKTNIETGLSMLTEELKFTEKRLQNYVSLMNIRSDDGEFTEDWFNDRKKLVTEYHSTRMIDFPVIRDKSGTESEIKKLKSKINTLKDQISEINATTLLEVLLREPTKVLLGLD